MTWWKACTRLAAGARLQSILRKHGKDRARCALTTLVAVLGVNGEHGCDGKVGPLYAAPDYLLTFAPMLDEQELERALADLELAGIVDRSDPELGIELVGWDDRWRAITKSTARVQLHRARRKAEQERRAKRVAGPRPIHNDRSAQA